MEQSKNFDVIIVGGSYAGLSAAMALGRALRKVLVIDSGMPCNAQTPASHNFITHDGKIPAQINQEAKEQVSKYKTVIFYDGLATATQKTNDRFEVTTNSGDLFTARKMIFATGISDQKPAIPGFAECWGISVIHCPYCHGYEVKGEKTGLLINGEQAFDFAKLISNWTKKLTIFTNGKSTIPEHQAKILFDHEIVIDEREIAQIEHESGKISNLEFADGTKIDLIALYARIPFVQHCLIPQQLGCELTAQGHLKVNEFQETSVQGVFACGDNTWPMRSVANAVAAGNFAGAAVNKDLVNESF